MNRFLKCICTLALAAAAALPAHAEALITQGSSELGVGGGLDFKSAVGTDVSLGVRYAYFFWDQISLGGTVGVADNDAATSFKVGGVGEYNFKLPTTTSPSSAPISSPSSVSASPTSTSTSTTKRKTPIQATTA